MVLRLFISIVILVNILNNVSAEFRLYPINSKIILIKIPDIKPCIFFTVKNFKSDQSDVLYLIKLNQSINSYFDKLQASEHGKRLEVIWMANLNFDLLGACYLSFCISSPPRYLSDFVSLVEKQLGSEESFHVDSYKKSAKETLIDCVRELSISYLFQRVNTFLISAYNQQQLIPLIESKIKELNSIKEFNGKKFNEAFRKGTFQATIIGDVDECVIRDFADWGEKTFSGKEERPEPGVRNFDGKVHFFENKTLGGMHNAVMVLPMVNVNSPYYGHSLILKEILLPTLSQGMGGVLTNTLRFGAKPLYNVQSGWNRDLSLFFQCPDRETSLHIKALKDAMSLLLTQGVSEQQFMKAKQQAKAFVDYFKTDPNLLIQFINLLRTVTLSAEEANRIIASIEVTLDTLTCEQFNATLKEFYSPQHATYFYEGVVNTANGRRE